MTDSEIAAAADACLASLETDRPFLAIKMFLAQLRADAAWTDADVIEVQTRIIRAMMVRFGLKG